MGRLKFVRQLLGDKLGKLSSSGLVISIIRRSVLVRGAIGGKTGLTLILKNRTRGQQQRRATVIGFLSGLGGRVGPVALLQLYNLY